jgi:hypothetical protein
MVPPHWGFVTAGIIDGGALTMDRFFSVLTRVNSVLLFLLLAGGGVTAVGLFGASLFFGRDANRRGEVVVQATETDTGQGLAHLRLGQFEVIAGANAQMMRLLARSEGGKFLSGGYDSDARNILFLAGEGKRAQWLIPKHANLITQVAQISEGNKFDRHNQSKPTRALYFEYVVEDTDGDGRLTRNDLSVVALARPDGSGMVEILKRLSQVLAYEWVGENQLGIVYQAGKEVRYDRYSLETFARVSEQLVLEVPERL